MNPAKAIKYNYMNNHRTRMLTYANDLARKLGGKVITTPERIAVISGTIAAHAPGVVASGANTVLSVNWWGNGWMFHHEGGAKHLLHRHDVERRLKALSLS